MFTYSGNNHALAGFLDAIELVMETGFAVTGFLALILNLILPEEIEDEEVPELTANEVDEKADEEEWARIQRGKAEPDADHEKGRQSGSTADIEATKMS